MPDSAFALRDVDAYTLTVNGNTYSLVHYPRFVTVIAADVAALQTQADREHVALIQRAPDGTEIDTSSSAQLPYYSRTESNAKYAPIGSGGGGTVTYGTTAGTAAQGNDSRIVGAAQKSANLSDLASAATARTNLGLSTAAATGASPDLTGKPTIPAAYTDLSGSVPASALPALAINDTFQVTDQAAMLALTAQRGDIAIRQDRITANQPAVFILGAEGASTLANWINLPIPADVVLSVDGQTGTITLPSDGAAGTATKRTLGTGATQAAAGNDARFTDQRTPSDGSVTNAKVGSGAAIDEAKLNLASDAGAGTASRRTLGTGAAQAAAGNDGRITGAAQKAQNLSDLASASTARTNLGLGTLATVSPTGTPDGTKFLRDDNTYAVPTGGGSSSGAANRAFVLNMIGA